MKNVKNGHKTPIVCLDAGHYGKYNRSPAVKDYYESDMTWKLHLMLKEALEGYGIKVTTTRTDKNKDLGLNARGKASAGCDLLLSLHSNAVGSKVNEDVDYVVVYHLYEDSGTDIDDKSKALAKMITPVIAETMGVKQGGRTSTRKGSGDWNGDGVMNDNYYSVLHGAYMVGTPALILEHSFHTQTRATKWLLEEENLRKLAQVEAAVIAEYFDVAKTQEQTQHTTNTFAVELTILRRGMEGEKVESLQALLIGNGHAIDKDGIFGPATEKAVESYQGKHRLDQDGVVGPATWGSLLGL